MRDGQWLAGRNARQWWAVPIRFAACTGVLELLTLGFRDHGDGFVAKWVVGIFAHEKNALGACRTLPFFSPLTTALAILTSPSLIGPTTRCDQPPAAS